MDDRNFRFTVSLVSALADLGVEHAVASPGARNSPMSFTLASEARISDVSFHDERSAGFFALGIGKASGRPAVVTCTSGTAVAELHPAMIEARYGRVPLIAITADRPSELWETGSPQTIDQRGIFGGAPLWSHDLDVPAPGEVPGRYPAALAARLVMEARSGPGPVHLNLRFREPLIPSGDLPDPVGPAPSITLGIAAPDAADVAAAAAALDGRRGLVVAGPVPDVDPDAILAVAAALGFPVLADPQSLVFSSESELVVRAGAALSSAGMLDRTGPEAALRIGPPPTAKPIWSWLEAHPEIPQVLVADTGWPDPGATASHVVRADPSAVLEALAAAATDPAPADWLDEWRTADDTAHRTFSETLGGRPGLTEPGIAAEVCSALPAGSLLYVSSSMPIRDVDLVAGSAAPGIRIAANRGANGIDGVISSGLGAAVVWDGPVAVLAGDLAFLHDLTALAAADRLGIPLDIVVVDNNGGGIFHFLPQAGHPDVFERHFGTPHDLDLAAAARGLGVEAVQVSDAAHIGNALREPPAAPRVLIARTDRETNVAIHHEMTAAIERNLAG